MGSRGGERGANKVFPNIFGNFSRYKVLKLDNWAIAVPEKRSLPKISA